MDEINLTIDGTEVRVERGITVLQAAESAGIYIPALCSHPSLPSYREAKPNEFIYRGTELIKSDNSLKEFEGCQLCVVEIEGMEGLPTACTTEVTEGMVVHTNTPQVQEKRRDNLELILVEHPNMCLTCERKERCQPFDICLRSVAVAERCVLCPENGHCELQKAVDYIGLREVTIPYTYKGLPVKRDNPCFDRDYNLCIGCTCCVRACQEVRGVSALGFIFQDGKVLVGTKASTLDESECEFCGACVDVCPVGALAEKNRRFLGREADLRKVPTTCPWCGCGCTIELNVKDNRIVSVTPAADGVVNHGQLCVKGKFGLDFVHSPERLTTPLIRDGEKGDGKFREASWDEALDLVANKLAEIKSQSGPDSLAVLSSAKCTNEENFLMQKLTRAVLGTNNVDHCARLCHAPTVAGLVKSFGSGAMTNSIAELREADCILIIGSNTSENHPIIALEVIKAVKHGKGKLIVADPRKIRMTNYAHLWLRQKPGTDVALINGMLHIIITENLYDADFVQTRTEGFEELKEAVMEYTPSVVSQITGVAVDDLQQAARLYAQSPKAAILYAMGITQHTTGTDNVMDCANLAMLTGHVGKESTGVNPLRGQNNVQGACDLGALPNVFPGYQSVADETIRSKFEQAWGVSLPGTPGLTVVEMMHQAEAGQIKGMYIMAENPIISDPNSTHVAKALENLDFLVVQDIFLTETAKFADVVLPGTSLAERNGTTTNTERRIQRINKAIEPIGDSRPDWLIITQLASRLGYTMTYKDPGEIMEEIAPLTPIYGGIHYDRLDQVGLQWPCRTRDDPGTKFLHKDSFTRGLGKFNPTPYREPFELPDEDYPFILSTGGILFHWRSGTMSRHSPSLDELRPEAEVEINPQDAERLRCSDGDLVELASRRGEILVKVKVTEKSPQGVAFMTYHFKEAPVNRLTVDALDPVAKIPEFKVCSIRISPVTSQEQ